MHATEYLLSKDAVQPVAVVVLYGQERYLKLEVLKRIPGCSGDESELSLTKLVGADTSMRDVLSELSARSMFADQRVVLVEDADDFVSDNRPALEKYVAKPSKSSVLILSVKSWPKTTKLYKAVEATGLGLECSELKGAALVKWVQKIAKDEHRKSLDRDAAALIVQLAGDSLGLLQQEVDKLASLVGDADVISQADVSKVVGGWRTETTWVMLDAVRDNRMDVAITALDKLLMAGEAPLKILAGTTFTFRRMAEATESARTGTPLPDALAATGIFPFAIGAFESYLRRIGYDRASRILQWLAEADYDMKGGSRVDPRLLLERLFVRLAGAAPTGIA